MHNHLAGRVPVGHDHSVESPFSSQYVLKQPFVACGRDSIDGVERSHQGHRTGVHTCLERREINIAQSPFGEFDCVVVTASFGRPVAYKMLEAGGNGGRIPIALITTYHSGAHHGVKVRILSGTLGDPAPAWIP